MPAVRSAADTGRLRPAGMRHGMQIFAAGAATGRECRTLDYGGTLGST